MNVVLDNARRALDTSSGGGDLVRAALGVDAAAVVTTQQFEAAWAALTQHKHDFIDQRALTSLAISLGESEPFADLTAARSAADAVCAERKAALGRSKAEAEALRVEIAESDATVAGLHVGLQRRRAHLAAALQAVEEQLGGSGSDGGPAGLLVEGGVRLTSLDQARHFIATQVGRPTIACALVLVSRCRWVVMGDGRVQR